MLNDGKIKLANRNVNNYLKDGLMKKKYPDNKTINIFKQKSEESILVAELIFEKIYLIYGLLWFLIMECIILPMPFY